MKRSLPLNSRTNSSGSVLPAHGQGGEVQARRPSLRAVHELGNVGRGQLDLLPLEESGCLIRDEREVCCTDLAEPPTGAQATEAQTWVGTGGDQHMGLRRKVFDQEPDLVVAGLLTHEMEVVENDDHLPRHRRQCRQQLGQHPGLDLAGVRRHEGGPVRTQRTSGSVECSANVGPEPHRVIVTGVEGHPGGGSGCITGREPLREERGLPEAGGCGDQHDWAKRGIVQLIDKATAYDPFFADLHRMQLRFEQRVPRGLRLGTHAQRLWCTIPAHVHLPRAPLWAGG